MSTIGSILSIGYQALAASQNGINVTSNNIANASTDGYARQRPVIRANTPVYLSFGALGTGVSLADVEQVRDTHIDRTFRRESGTAGFAESRGGILSRMEAVLNEPSTTGLSGVMGDFLNAWSELATNPGDTTMRRLAREAGGRMADTFRNVSTQLDLVRAEGEDRLRDAVGRVNALSEEISILNRDIVAVEAGGISANDLRDSRNRALDQLSSLVEVTAHERDDGSVGVSLQGYTIADRDAFTRLEVRTTGGAVGIGLDGRSGLVAGVGGEVGGTVTALNQDLGDARSRLDALAAAVVDEVNALHRTGTSPNGATGMDFFDPAGVTASSMALSADIVTDLGNMAAGTADGTGAYRAGANDVALGIAAFRTTPAAALGETFTGSYRGLVSDVGMNLRSSSDAGEVARTLADSAARRRESVSGVSTDEELVNLIRYQTAYQSAARVITVADEMMQTLLAI